jgi:uncharacterized protein YbaR (Trm112 family)
MPTKSSKPVSFDHSVVGQLACPVCRASFVLSEEKLICQGCGRAYPIVDGIPILIAERTIPGIS